MISKRGISLVEILIATSLLLATMVPLWGLMGSSHQQVVRSYEEVKASQLAAEILEQLENAESLSKLPGDGNSIECNLNSGGVVTVNGSGAEMVIKISKFEEYLLPKLFIECNSVASKTSSREIGRMVTVTIEYKSKEGRDLEYTLRGFVSAFK